MRNKTSTKRNSIILLRESDNFAWNGHSSEYFVAVSHLSVLSARGGGVLAGGSDGRLCWFSFADFDKNEEDIWPTNAQMDFSKSSIGRARAAVAVSENEVLVGGDFGMLVWDVSVTKTAKRWRKVSERCQVEAAVEYKGEVWFAGEDGVVRAVAADGARLFE